ncbi:Hypp2577 [Branchiostoma lanceolatum]|uniref:Hypp2577 protein n=1 Tax=Branchiostoma lanceolatum TaxID=7740 RepID=A0A8J9ZVA7_BRALA|nr:Hypp2577 [Branchiostoma lanceolatum]
MFRTVCLLALASLSVAYDAGLRGSIYFAIDGINRGSGLDNQLVLEEVLRSAEVIVSRVETQHKFTVRLAYSECRNGAADALAASQRCPVQDAHRSVECTASVTQVLSDAGVGRRLVGTDCGGAASLDAQTDESLGLLTDAVSASVPGTYEAGQRGSIYFAIDSINQRSVLDNQWVLEEVLRSGEQVVSREESRHSFAVRLAYSDCPNGAADAVLSAQRCSVPDPHRSQDCKGTVIQYVSDSGVRRRIAELECGAVQASQLQASASERDAARPILSASLTAIIPFTSYDVGVSGSIYFAIDAINRGSAQDNQWVLEAVMKSGEQEVSDVKSVHRFAIRIAYSDCQKGTMNAETATIRCPVPEPHRSQDCSGSVVQQVSDSGGVRRRVENVQCGVPTLQVSSVPIQG